jgi:hypothetical protein
MTRIEPTVLSLEAKIQFHEVKVVELRSCIAGRFEPALLSLPFIERRSIMTFWAEDSHPR